MIPNLNSLPTIPTEANFALKAYAIDVRRGLRGPIQTDESDAVQSLPIGVDPRSHITSTSHLLYPLMSSIANGKQRFRSSDGQTLHMFRKFQMDGMNHDLEIYSGNLENIRQSGVCFGSCDGQVIQSRSNAHELSVHVYSQHRGKAIEQGYYYDWNPGTSDPSAESIKLRLNWTTVKSIIPRLLRELRQADRNVSEYTYLSNQDSLDHGHVAQIHVDAALMVSSWLLLGNWNELEHHLNAAKLFVGNDSDTLDVNESGIVLPSETIVRTAQYLQHSLDTGSEPYVQILHSNGSLNSRDNTELLRVAVCNEGITIQQKTKPEIESRILKSLTGLASSIEKLIQHTNEKKQTLHR